MRFSFVRRSMLAVTVVALNACHEPPQAPVTKVKPGPEWVRLTMDDGLTDYPSFGGLDLLSQSDTEFDFVVAETEYGSLRYGGCVQNCQDPTRWMTGTIDSGVYRGLGENATSVRTGQTITVAYEDQQTSEKVKIAICGGACFLKGSWRSGDIRGGFLGSSSGTHSRVLAVGRAGDLSLLYHGPGLNNVFYAHCPSACTDSASWQSVLLDSGQFAYRDDGLTVDSSGVVHALIPLSAGGGLTYFRCDSACSARSNWQSLMLDTGAVGGTPSILVGSSGTLYATYAEAHGTPVTAIRLAMCAANCLTSANWSVTSLPAPAGWDISLLLDAAEHPWVATTYGECTYCGGTTTVLHCTAACSSPGSWTSMTIDSLGDGRDISMALDANGQPRIVVSGDGVHYLQRPDTAFLIRGAPTTASHR